MTTKPELNLGDHLLPGVVAVALFAAMTLIFLNAGFEAAAGFPEDASITASIGYAMFNIDAGTVGAIPSEGFLVAFIVIAFVLDAALEGAVMLAEREDQPLSSVARSVVRTDGGGADDGADAGASGSDASGGER